MQEVLYERFLNIVVMSFESLNLAYMIVIIYFSRCCRTCNSN